MMLDLTPFCSIDPDRPDLHKPTSHGNWTYATTNHVLLRVPRRDDVPENTKAEDCAAKFTSYITGTEVYTPLSCGPLPVSTKITCDVCSGYKNRFHDCPSCKCKCTKCDEHGQIEQSLSIDIAGVPFDVKYIALLQTLPGIRIATPQPGTPMLFQFDGGDGMLMPLKWPR